MARIYNSRTLLDPSLLSLAEQKKQQYIQNNRDYLNKQTEAINTAIQGIGKAATDAYGRYSRRNLVEDAEAGYDAWDKAKQDEYNTMKADPYYQAAVDKFIQTGDPSSMNAYKQNILMQKMKAEEATKKAEEAAKAAQWHENVQFGTDQANVAKLTSQMYQALDNGHLAEAQAIQQQIKSYEDKWAPKNKNFGNTAEAMLNARQEELKTKADEGAKENNRKYNAQIFINEKIPKFYKDEDAKKPVYADIKNAVGSGILTPEEATTLMQKVENTETNQTLGIKARANAAANASGEQTKKNIQDTQDKKEAQGYVGQKMNSLQFNHLPENVKKHLTRDGQGVVKMR